VQTRFQYIEPDWKPVLGKEKKTENANASKNNDEKDSKDEKKE
jgi:hypothetical protein